MSRKYRDGWHTIQGYEVYVENGRVLRGLKTTHYPDNEQAVAAYPYRLVSDGWSLCAGISVAAFAAGVRRDTIRLF